LGNCVGQKKASVISTKGEDDICVASMMRYSMNYAFNRASKDWAPSGKMLKLHSVIGKENGKER
jgi:hypothetical protein